MRTSSAEFIHTIKDHQDKPKESFHITAVKLLVQELLHKGSTDDINSLIS